MPRMTSKRFFEIATPAASGRYGAPMGRGDYGPADADRAIARQVHLRQVPLDAGGYDPGGAYWGHAADGTTLYVALADAHWLETAQRDARPLRMFVRARSRDAAKRAVGERYPGARFFDGTPAVQGAAHANVS